MKSGIYIILILNLLFFVFSSCEEEFINFDGQNSSLVTIDWQTTIGEKDFDDIQQIISTSDGGYIAIGSMLNVDWNYWVLKFNADTLQWQKTYGGSNADFGCSILETNDGNFVLIGYSNSVDGNITINNGAYDVWVVKIDSQGNILWENCYGGSGNETVSTESIIPGDLGGFVFTATTNSSDWDVTDYMGGTDIWVVNINDSSEILWAKTFGGTADDFGGSIKLTADSLYFLNNIVLSDDVDVNYNYEGKDIWLIRVNQVGDLMWQKTVGGTGTENQCDIDMTADGGLILMAQTNSEDGDVQENYGDKDIWFSKLNSNGNIEWKKTFGGSLEESLGDIKQLSDGSYIAVCNSSSHDYYLGYNYGKVDICLVKLSAAGELQWTKVIGGSSDDNCNSVIEGTEKSLIVAGNTKSEDYDILSHIGGFDFWLMKVGY